MKILIIDLQVLLLNLIFYLSDKLDKLFGIDDLVIN